VGALAWTKRRGQCCLHVVNRVSVCNLFCRLVIWKPFRDAEQDRYLDTKFAITRSRKEHLFFQRRDWKHFVIRMASLLAAAAMAFESLYLEEVSATRGSYTTALRSRSNLFLCWHSHR
jgi:hypothetical protein